ncbi:hypothetical protein [Enterobacter hormaechei]|uniref:hypothetical protein n=1 Tax=Enterobacter hormaechei TaxID=158836 RepID=UPI000A91E865
MNIDLHTYVRAQYTVLISDLTPENAMIPIVLRLSGIVSATQLPSAIGYPAGLATRQMAMVYDEQPDYLLVLEVNAPHNFVPDLHRKMLLATLRNTDARIKESLALTQGDFSQDPPYQFMELSTLTQHADKVARMAGCAPAGSQAHHQPSISDTVGVVFGLFGTMLVYTNVASFMPDPNQAVFWTEELKQAAQLDSTLMLLAFVLSGIRI